MVVDDVDKGIGGECGGVDVGRFDDDEIKGIQAKEGNFCDGECSDGLNGLVTDTSAHGNVANER